jgi:hypothetical protein
MISYVFKIAGYVEKRITSVSCIPGGISFGVAAVCVRKMKAFSENNESVENDALAKACRWRVTIVCELHDINKYFSTADMFLSG